MTSLYNLIVKGFQGFCMDNSKDGKTIEIEKAVEYLKSEIQKFNDSWDSWFKSKAHIYIVYKGDNND